MFDDRHAGAGIHLDSNAVLAAQLCRRHPSLMGLQDLDDLSPVNLLRFIVRLLLQETD